jgi:hypothetical protein
LGALRQSYDPPRIVRGIK